jgi:hypothetical protein
MGKRCCSMFLGILVLGLTGSATAKTWTIFTNQAPKATEGDRDMRYELGTKFKTTVGARVVKARVYASASEEAPLASGRQYIGGGPVCVVIRRGDRGMEGVHAA